MNIFFIGIGGIGVSALARYYLENGHKVSGSDLCSSEITSSLKEAGARIFFGKHKSKNILRGTDLVVFSPAVNKQNPEYKEAKKRNIKLQSYPQALGELTKKMFTIAVSGTHGKSTTTAMIGILLERAGLDPTVIVGTKIREFGDTIRSKSSGLTLSHAEGSNCRVGKSKYLVIEADEHFASFLNYWPKILVLTNIEADHLDYYKNIGNILKTFKKYIGHLLKDGILVSNGDDKNISKIKIQKSKFKNQNYSIKQPEAGKLKKILKIPGDHIVSDALAALAVARALKIPDKISFKALSGYKGAWRRFETVKTKPYILISDYAHNPTKVRVTLQAAREKWPKKKIWCAYQPHQYQRTYYLFKDFVKVFRKAPVDKIIITDIFDVAGRETKAIKKDVSPEKLVQAVKKSSVTYMPKEKIVSYLKKNVKNGEVVIIMGAGDIYKLCEQF